MTRLSAVLFLIVGGAAAAVPAVPSSSYFNVMSYKAKADGITNDSAAIQKAIDVCERAGGGVVYFPAGNFLSGTIVLKSNVALHFSPGATLWGSKKIKDYNPHHLIYAKDAENIAIEGGGSINGNGEAFWSKPNSQGSYRPVRPRPSPLIEFVNCRDVRIRDVRIRNAPGWTIHPLDCDRVDIRGISIINNIRGPNTDGIDPDSSRNVHILNSYIENGDDCIVVKTKGGMGKPVKPSENITVTNCTLTTRANAFKIGTESLGDFRNISVSNCTMFRKLGAYRGPKSGVAIEMVDGASLDGVVISNITMRGVDTPIFIRLGNRGRGQQIPTPGTLKNISINNIVATGGLRSSSITGLPGHPARYISLSNINITMKGGQQYSRRGLDVPEFPGKYPEATMFGSLPTYGLFSRHVEGLFLRNVQVRWESEDMRPAMIFDDVKDLAIEGFETQTVTGEQPVLWFNNVAGALVRGCRTVAGTQRFLRVTGANARAIKLAGNALAATKHPVDLGPGAHKEAVLQ